MGLMFFEKLRACAWREFPSLPERPVQTVVLAQVRVLAGAVRGLWMRRMRTLHYVVSGGDRCDRRDGKAEGKIAMYMQASIQWIKKETRDTSTYCLKLKEKFVFQPGQFNMLYVPGIGEAPISISSSPSAPELLHTIRVAGDVTTALSRLAEGDTILLRGPYGTGWPMEELRDRTLVVIAGGLGIAPLRPVLKEVMRKDYGLSSKPVILYGCKSPKDIIFRDEFPRFRDVFDVYLSVDKADPEMIWRGETGFVSELISKINVDPLKSVAIVEYGKVWLILIRLLFAHLFAAIFACGS